MSVKLVQVLVNLLFLVLDSVLCLGRYIGFDELDNYVFLMDFQEYLEEFYVCYNVEFICVLEGFFYLCLCFIIFILCFVLSELDMMVGKIFCYFYFSLEWLVNEGIFIQQELYDELFILVDEVKLLKLVNNCLIGLDVDRQKLQEKVCFSFNCLCRLGMVWFMGYDSSKFRIIESVFCFGVDVCVGDDFCEVQCRLICDGEVMSIENYL